MKSKKISLNMGEQLACKAIAKERYSTARGAGVTNSRVGKQSDEETDLEGVAAELAFAKYYSEYPTGVFDIGARSSKKGEDADGDIKINGYIVDVKATRYHKGRLIAAEWKDHSSIDYYALVVGTFPSYEVKGVMRTSDLITKERLKTLPRGTNKVYQAEQDELQFPKELEKENN
tara:strand:+ start:245 stop:769 length:525 start_codon:yes stop_codon:yes gene_type:complete